MMHNQTVPQLLLDWFRRQSRQLPWRQTYSPYHIWISEIMLQQTQMDRATHYFRNWLTRFPDIRTLAESREQEVLKYWEGLGYYARARNLRRTARLLVQEHGGRLPDDFDQLLALPGIGRYTAGAIMSLAFNREVPAVDANVERVFARMFDLDRPVKEKGTAALIRRQARGLIPPGQARWFNQALMELGGVICLPRTPHCGRCPVEAHCESRRLGIETERPVPWKSRQICPLEVVTGVLLHQGLVFIQKRPERGAWANLWEFPGGRLEDGETPAAAVVREFLEETELRLTVVEPLGLIRHGYTKYRVTLHGFLCTLAGRRTIPTLHAAQEYRWAAPAELAHLAFPAGHRKLINQLRQRLWTTASPESLDAARAWN